MGSVGMACAVLFIVAVSVSGVLTAAIHGEAQLGQPDSSSVSGLHFQHLVKRSAGGPQKLCGTRLVDALRHVCAQRFYTQKRRSGSGGSSTGGYKSEDGGDSSFDGFGWDSLGFDPASAQYGQSGLGDAYWDKDSDVVIGAGSGDVELFWPHNPKSLTYKVLTEGTSHNRVRRSIVEDCCMRSCTLNQMVKYCAVSG